MIVQTQSWQKVTKFYRDRTENNPFFRPMMELAEQIAASKYASGLYPWTSMHTRGRSANHKLAKNGLSGRR
jgi:hypothetical protein